MTSPSPSAVSTKIEPSVGVPHSPPGDLAKHKARTRFLPTPTPPPPEYDDPQVEPEPEAETDTSAFYLSLQGATFPSPPRTLTPSRKLIAHIRSASTRYAVVRDSLT